MLILNGKMFKTAAQPPMVTGVFIARETMSTKEGPSTTVAVQAAVVTITPPPKLNMFRTAPQLPGPIIAPAMISGDREPLVLVLREPAKVQPKMNSIRTAERIIARHGAATTVKTTMSIAKEPVMIRVVRELLALTTPIRMKKKSRSAVLVIGLTTTSARVIGARENG